MSSLRADLAVDGQLVFSIDDLRRAGYGPNDIARHVAHGDWHRLRRGWFVAGDRWAGADETERHLLVARAVSTPYGRRAALTHTTGALGLGVSLWRPDLRNVHLTHVDAVTGRIEHGVNHHGGPLDPTSLVERDGLVIGPPAEVVTGAMLLSDLDGAVVAGDSALRTGITNADAIEAVAGSWMRRAASRTVRFAVPLLDDGADNPGESLGRLLLWRKRFPRPKTQYEVRGGGRVAFADFGWRESGVLGEFDGKRKYQRDLREGEDPGEVVFREKQREDWLRRLGWTVCRFVWADLFTPDETAARFRAAFRDAARLPRPA